MGNANGSNFSARYLRHIFRNLSVYPQSVSLAEAALPNRTLTYVATLPHPNVRFCASTLHVHPKRSHHINHCTRHPILCTAH